MRDMTEATKHYVLEDGTIQSGIQVPDGATLIGEGLADWENIEVAARHMYDGSFTVGAMRDAYKAKSAKNFAERASLLQLMTHPDDTPEQQLERWLKWRQLGRYRPAEIRKAVFKALKNAVFENDYTEELSRPLIDVAVDLTTMCADCEIYELAEIIPHIEAFRDEHAGAVAPQVEA